jgi:hypothetical protein
MKEWQPCGVVQSGCSCNRGPFPSIARTYAKLGSARLADSSKWCIPALARTRTRE